MKTVVVTQPYVPAYRVPLFDEIDKTLGAAGYRLQVVSGIPRGAQAQRGDSATGPWHRIFEAGHFRIGGRSIRAPRLPKDLRGAEVVVTELEASNLLAWARVATRRRTVLWGHGKAYVTEPNELAEWLEAQLARTATAVMTYAPGGRESLVARGVNPDRVSVIGNATDTREILAWRASRSSRELEDILCTAGEGPRALFVGGLDASKRIDFLLDALRVARHIDSRFSATIVGDGAMRPAVEEFCADRDWCRFVPEARGAALAEIASVCGSLWMPGRVGLVAVDALALQLPVFTTAHAHHAPEIEFLRPGEYMILANEPSEFAREALSATARLRGPSQRPMPDPRPLAELDGVADSFVRVVLEAVRW